MLTSIELSKNRKQENRFHETLALFNAVIESTADALLVVNDEGKIVAYNQNFVNLWKIPSDVLESLDHALVLDFEMNQLLRPESFLAKVQDLYSNPMAESFDILELKDHRVIERYSKPQIVRSVAVGRVWSFRDVTNLKLVEKNLKQSRDYYLSIINSVNDYIMVVDSNCRVNYVNQTVTAQYSKDVIGSTWLEWVDPEFTELARRTILEINATGKSKTIELRAPDPQKKKIWFQVKFSPIPSSAEGEISLIATDITDQRNAELRLNEARLAAESANQAKSAFLANMSHEIRPPLGAVMGFAELIANDEINENEKKNYAAAIKRNGELLSNIISDILDLSKIEVGKLKMDRQEVSLVEILSDLETLLLFKAEEKAIDFSFKFSGLLPRVITTDSLRVRQILLNVIGNSIKFTEYGSVVVEVKIQSSEQSSLQLAFIVTDTGIGISKEQEKELFHAFSQADVSILSKYGGTGLGLILSRRLAQMLGGDVVLTQSLPGKGSTFTIKIDPGPVGPLAALDYEKEKGSLNTELASAPTARLDDVKVLVVDDSEDNQLLISKVLKIAGAEIDTAENGETALAKFDDKKYDVLLVDLQMPIMDGYETTIQLRKKGYKTPIIALTAHALKEIRQRCLESGFDDFITKPVNRNLLINKIAHFVKK